MSNTEHRCPNCHLEIDGDSRFCKHCAFDLTKPTAEPVKAAFLSKTGWIVVGTLITVLLLGSAVFLIVRRSGDSAPSSSANSNSSVPKLSWKAEQAEYLIVMGKPLSADQLTEIPTAELRILRNAVFARHGRTYERPGLGDYFYSTKWYAPNTQYNDSLLTADDKANVNLILSLEKPAQSTVASTPITTPAPSSDGALTLESAQDAIDRFMSANASGTMRIRGGVREIPSENSAIAEITMDNFRSRDGKFYPQTTPYGRSLSWTTGKAVFSKYTDGRWVLSQLIVIQDSTGYTGTYKPDIEIR